jgi:hypothetical protein
VSTHPFGTRREGADMRLSAIVLGFKTSHLLLGRADIVKKRWTLKSLLKLLWGAPVKMGWGSKSISSSRVPKQRQIDTLK